MEDLKYVGEEPDYERRDFLGTWQLPDGKGDEGKTEE